MKSIIFPTFSIAKNSKMIPVKKIRQVSTTTENAVGSSLKFALPASCIRLTVNQIPPGIYLAICEVDMIQYAVEKSILRLKVGKMFCHPKTEIIKFK